MSASYYCEGCDLNWPRQPGYKTCPGCSAETVYVQSMDPMDSLVAAQRASDLTLSRTRHAQFAAFCEERDQAFINAEAEKFRVQLDQFAGVPE